MVNLIYVYPFPILPIAMDGTAMVAFIGRKGSGKTTFLTRLIPILIERGHRVGVIKRVPPHFEIDQEGKDSFRLKEAGASAVFLSSERRIALIEDVPAEREPEEIASKYLDHMDIILVEGFKRSALPKVEVYRKGLGEGPLFRELEVIAAITDDPALELPPGVERFSFEEPERVADLIEDRSLKVSHEGMVKMVDVGGKPETERTALAQGRIKMSRATLRKIIAGEVEKGDVLAVARVAAIMGAKRTADLLPLCHPLRIDAVDVEIELEDEGIVVRVRVFSRERTGVEMEALSACSTALLTIYDMCKGLERGMEIRELKLLEKRGGRSGDWIRGKDEGEG